MKRDGMQCRGCEKRYSPEDASTEYGQLRDTYTYLVFNRSTNFERVIEKWTRRREERLRLALDAKLPNNYPTIRRDIGEFQGKEDEEGEGNDRNIV